VSVSNRVQLLVYFKSFLTYLICFISTILGTNSINSAVAPLGNKQTKLTDCSTGASLVIKNSNVEFFC